MGFTVCVVKDKNEMKTFALLPLEAYLNDFFENNHL